MRRVEAITLAQLYRLSPSQAKQVTGMVEEEDPNTR